MTDDLDKTLKEAIDRTKPKRLSRTERIVALKEHVRRRIQNVIPNMALDDPKAQVWLEVLIEVVCEWNVETMYEFERRR